MKQLAGSGVTTLGPEVSVGDERRVVGSAGRTQRRAVSGQPVRAGGDRDRAGDESDSLAALADQVLGRRPGRLPVVDGDTVDC
jgi:hypothetical protein